MADVKWPSRKELDAVLKRLEKTEGTLHLRENATPLEKFRWELCQRLIAYKRIHGLKQKELAERLGLDEPEMSRILHHRIDKVSTDKLVGLLQELNPDIELKVS